MFYIQKILNVITKFVNFLTKMSESQKKYDYQKKVQQKASQKKRKAYIQSNIQKQNTAQQINSFNNCKKPSMSPFHIQSLPLQIHQLILSNKLLSSQNKLLQCELKQKQELIKILKKDIHKSIIQETQNKLYCLNVIQEEAESKAKQIIHRKMQYISTDDQQIHQLKQHNNQLQALINKQTKTNRILAQNVVELKHYIIQAMDQKDQIIKQLKKMIMLTEQDKSTHLNIDQSTKHNLIKKNNQQLQSKTIKMPHKTNKAKIIRNN